MRAPRRGGRGRAGVSRPFGRLGGASPAARIACPIGVRHAPPTLCFHGGTPMCGIVGYVGQRPVQELLLAGLEKLEYRGYDSAGITRPRRRRAAGVRARGRQPQPPASRRRQPRRAGGRRRRGGRRAARHHRHRPHPLGHARARERGERPPALRHRRSRPRGRQRDRRELPGAQAGAGPRRRRLHVRDRRRGHRPSRLPAARGGRRAHRGRPRKPTTGCAATTPSWPSSADEPDLLVAARKECPLILGRGDGEQFVASAIPAFLAYTREVQLIENGEIVDGAPRGRRVHDRRRRARRARRRDRRLGRRGRREGRLRDVHAQGDPRAGRRCGRDDRRPHRAARRRRPRRPRDDRRRVPARPAAGWSSSPAAPPTTPA